jgi:hypothetical protein
MVSDGSPWVLPKRDQLSEDVVHERVRKSGTLHSVAVVSKEWPSPGSRSKGNTLQVNSVLRHALLREM